MIQPEILELIQAVTNINEDISRFSKTNGEEDLWIWVEVVIESEGYGATFLGEVIYNSNNDIRDHVDAMGGYEDYELIETFLRRQIMNLVGKISTIKL